MVRFAALDRDKEINYFDKSGIQVVEIGRSGLARKIGRGAYNRFSENADKLSAKVGIRYPYAYAAVRSHKVRGQIAGLGVYHRGWTFVRRHIFFQFGVDVADILPHLMEILAQNKHTLAMVAMFYAVHFFYGLGVGGIAAYAPDGVGGIKDDPSPTKHFGGFLQYLLFVHFCSDKILQRYSFFCEIQQTAIKNHIQNKKNEIELFLAWERVFPIPEKRVETVNRLPEQIKSQFFFTLTWLSIQKNIVNSHPRKKVLQHTSQPTNQQIRKKNER